MASIGVSYNPDAIPSRGYQPLPAGEYTLEIVETDYVTNAKGTGMILKCKAQIVGGEFEGRPFYINYELEHRAQTRQERGQGDFAGLRRATGVLNPEDSEELHWKPFGVKIGVREDAGANVIRQKVGLKRRTPGDPGLGGACADRPASAAASLGSRPANPSDSG